MRSYVRRSVIVRGGGGGDVGEGVGLAGEEDFLSG